MQQVSEPLHLLEAIKWELSPAIIMIDNRMPGLAGISLAVLVRKQSPSSQIALFDPLQDMAVKKECRHHKITYVSDMKKAECLIQEWCAVTVRPQDNISKMSLDYNQYSASYENKKIPLYKKEFELLQFFLRNSHRVLTRTEILEHLWGYDITAMTNTIDVHVHRLRKKLEKYTQKKYIQTIHSVGYRLITE